MIAQSNSKLRLSLIFNDSDLINHVQNRKFLCKALCVKVAEQVIRFEVKVAARFSPNVFRSDSGVMK